MDRDEELDRRLFLVAQLYYERHLTQKEISTELGGVPQPTISRWLDEVRKSHWLKVRVVEDYQPYRLENLLCKEYGLRECRIALTHDEMDVDEMCDRLGLASAKYLVHLLTNEQSFRPRAGAESDKAPQPEKPINIGISGGTTLLNMANQIPAAVKPFAPTHLYPALGFFPTESNIRFVNAVVIVSAMMARIEKSLGYWLPVPPLLQEPIEDLEQRRQALWELFANIRLVSDLLKVVNNDLDIVFTGMGSIAYDGEGALLAGASAGKNFVAFASDVDAQWRRTLESKKIIGDLSFLPFNESGPVHIDSLKWARMGIRWKSLCAMAAPRPDPKRVVLVCGGVEKHETLYKLLMLDRAHRPINVLITDITAAKFLERKLDEAKRVSGASADDA